MKLKLTLMSLALIASSLKAQIIFNNKTDETLTGVVITQNEQKQITIPAGQQSTFDSTANLSKDDQILIKDSKQQIILDRVERFDNGTRISSIEIEKSQDEQMTNTGPGTMAERPAQYDITINRSR